MYAICFVFKDGNHKLMSEYHTYNEYVGNGINHKGYYGFKFTHNNEHAMTFSKHKLIRFLSGMKPQNTRWKNKLPSNYERYYVINLSKVRM